MPLCRAAGPTALFALACWPGGFAAAADVYKCVENGRIVYQDYACRGPGSIVSMDRGSTEATTPAASAAAAARLKAGIAELDQAQKAREAASAIDAVERELRSYEQAEQSELAALRAKQDYANYNLPGAVWERAWAQQAIDKEMQAVTERYAALKQNARERIAQLRKGDAAAR